MKSDSSSANLPALRSAEVVQFSPLKKVAKPPTGLDTRAIAKALTRQRNQLETQAENGQMLTEAYARLQLAHAELDQARELLAAVGDAALTAEAQRLLAEMAFLKGEIILKRHNEGHPL